MRRVSIAAHASSFARSSGRLAAHDPSRLQARLLCDRLTPPRLLPRPRANPPDKRAEADALPGPVDGSPLDGDDPPPSDGCDPLGLLPLVPRGVPGWTVAAAPVFPYEIFAGAPVGFTGRLFRADSGCVVVGVSRPADVEAAVKALTVERPRTVDVGGRHGMVFPSLPANQVTTWVRDGADRLFLLRAYGTVDPTCSSPSWTPCFPRRPGKVMTPPRTAARPRRHRSPPTAGRPRTVRAATRSPTRTTQRRSGARRVIAGSGEGGAVSCEL